MAIKITVHNPALAIPFCHAVDLAPTAEHIKRTTKPAKFASYPTAPALWKKLHLRAIEKEGTEDGKWLADFAKEIPCGECVRHWREFLANEPPNFTAYFAWTVLAHNGINLRLGKPILSVDQARALYV